MDSFCRYRHLPVIAQVEVERLLPFYRAGDASAGQSIVEGNMRLVTHIVIKDYRGVWSRRGAPLTAEDLIQEGALGLYKALRYYDPTRSRFTTYSYDWIRDAIGAAMKSCARGLPVDRLSLDESFEFGDGFWESHGEVSTPAGLIDNPNVSRLAENAMDSAGLSAAVKTVLLERLPLREAVVLLLRYGIGTKTHTWQEIGNVLGVSHENARQIEKRLRPLLRAELLALLPEIESALSDN